MVTKKIVLLISLCISTIVFSQYEQIGEKWQIGIGAGLVKFSQKNAYFVGDKHLMQIPRLNITRKILNNTSVDVAMSFGVSDSKSSFLVKNNFSYWSLDISGRYSINTPLRRLDPFILLGVGFIETNTKNSTTPTINFGTGFSYWFTDIVGISSQAYYKRVLSPKTMSSHVQFTAGLLFGLNFNKITNRRSSSCYYNLYK